MGKVNTLEGISEKMNYRVYTRTPTFGGNYLTGDPPSSGRHYQAIGLKQLIKPEFETKDMPFEFRAVRQPETVEEYQLVTDLMNKRIKYIKSLKDEPIYYRVRKYAASKTYLEDAANFQTYLEEMGESWRTYEKIIPEKVLETLKDGEASDLIAGKIDWADPNRLLLFNNVMTDNFYLSPWTKARVKKILRDPSLPESALTNILDHLSAQSKEGPEHAKVVLAFLQSLKENGIAPHLPQATKALESAIFKVEQLGQRPQGNCFTNFIGNILKF